jgi:hypothetical protein
MSIPFMCTDKDTCRNWTAVETRYPEPAIYVNVSSLRSNVWTFTVGKDWTAKQTHVTYFDTTLQQHRVGDTAYFSDINNDGLQDVLIELQAQHGYGPRGILSRWILMLQDRTGGFAMQKIDQYGPPFYRRARKNFWLSTRLEEDTVKRTRYWVTDLFELKGSQFVNVGASRGFPRIEEYGGKLPRLTKKLRQSLRHQTPGLPVGWQPPELRD